MAKIRSIHPETCESGAERTRPPRQWAKAVVAQRLGCPRGGTIEISCAYCPAVGSLRWIYSGHPNCRSGQPVTTLTWDHVIPVSLGGSSDDPDNLVLACARCNSSKNNRPVDLWRGVA